MKSLEEIWKVVCAQFCFWCVWVFWGLHCTACGILVPRSGIEPRPSAVKVQNPNHWTTWEFPMVDFNCSSSVVKNPPANAGDMGSTPGSGRPPGERNGNPLQYSCLGNPMDRVGWWATVHGVIKNQSQLSTHTHNNMYPPL